jgi:type IV secretory pathway TraG/TraD family ATPase VirD4
MTQELTPNVVNFAGCELPETETQGHFVFIGTTGSGKTVLFRLLMQSVLVYVGLGLGYRSLIYDAKQDMLPILAAFADRKRTKTLNPHDHRGVAWDISADVTEPRIAMEIAYTLIPEASESQPYFANASRHILYGIMASFLLSRLNWTLADLLRAVSTPKLCRRVLERHPQTASIVPKYFRDKRLLNDIFSTLATKMLLYEPIAGSWEAASDRISLSAWANSEEILILGNSEIARVAIDNINRCIFKRATDLTLMKPEGTTDRTWIFIDEASEAGRLSLPPLLKKGRSKGARVAIGFQSISGLRDPKLYGQFLTDDILGQISNRFCGRLECPETAEFMSRVIGDAEVRQLSESRSHSFKGGTTTSQNWQPVIRRAVLPSEFMSVEPCDDIRGLTGLFTTRSDLPTWDHLPPKMVFDEMLIPPAEDVPDFVLRDPFTQFVLPWTEEQADHFAPPLSNHSERRRRPTRKPPEESPENDLDDLDL